SRVFTTNPQLPECPQFGIIRIEGDLYFAAMTYVEEQIAELYTQKPGQTKLFITCSAINHMDITGIESLVRIVDQRRKAGGDVFFYDINSRIMRIFEKSRALDFIGRDHIFTTKETALESIVPNLDLTICGNCKKRVFWECDQNKTQYRLKKQVGDI
ncbi:MAG TPA: sodium-independent anion transporter, partial [Thermodesulfovibrionia bacterium]|nr:sodium-independent anion transporter [Thermodesulfovibrionia bacterium]